MIIILISRLARESHQKFAKKNVNITDVDAFNVNNKVNIK